MPEGAPGTAPRAAALRPLRPGPSVLDDSDAPWSRQVLAWAIAQVQDQPGPSDSDTADRAGKAPDQEIPSHNKTWLAKRPFIRHTHTINMKASPSWAGFMHSCSKYLPSQQGMRAQRAVPKRPTATQGDASACT